MNKPNKISLLLCLFALVLVGLISSCKKDVNTGTPKNLVKDVAEHDVISNWNAAQLEIDRYAAGYRPCPIGRAEGYIGLATYETAVPGMPEYQSIAKNYSGLNIPAFDASKEINWPLAINAATAYMYKNFFVNEGTRINTVESGLRTKYSAGVSQAVIDASIKWGEDVAAAVWNFAKTDTKVHDAQLDASQGGPTAYTKLPGKGIFHPETNYPLTSVDGWFPHYGEGRVFTANSGSELTNLVPAPLPYSDDPSSQYYGQAVECLNMVKNGTYEDKWIAEFWSDDLLNLTFSPPARWFAIANQVYDMTNSNLEKALFVNTKLGLAMNDIVVACWGAKYKYQVERPVAFIRAHSELDPNFISILKPGTGITPPFPAYPSGHSTMGGGAAEVLTYEYGINFAMTDRCHEGRTEFNGTPRSFPDFYHMAEENAYSRIPLGVHWRMDCKQGIELGYNIARKVNKLPFKK